jgi:quercetin dioxygenase-like cupin family protein
MELTVAGKPQIFKKGDEYLVPAGSAHSAKFLRPTRVMDYFSEKNRYNPKQTK